MLIKFTKHALERNETWVITKEEVVDAITNPDKEINDSYGNIIAHIKEKKIGEKSLKIYFRIFRSIRLTFFE